MDLLSVSKMVVPIVASLTFLWGVVKGIRYAGSLHDTVKSTDSTVKLLATNHLPHIQESLNRQDTAIEVIRGDVKQVAGGLADHVKRFEDTKKIVDTFNQGLIMKAINKDIHGSE